jgi:transposase-like protein
MMKLIDLPAAFGTDEQCLAYLEHKRWPNGVRCPICGADKVSKITRKSKTKNKRAQLYQCLEPTCKQQFSATTGTIFHDSHLPLSKWFTAIALIVDAKKGMSALQLSRHLRCNYRTAWYLSHRIREAMVDKDGLKLTGTVEIGEVYLGGRQRGQKRKKLNKTLCSESGSAAVIFGSSKSKTAKRTRSTKQSRRMWKKSRPHHYRRRPVVQLPNNAVPQSQAPESPTQHP